MQRIADELKPEKIIPFGSYAYGSPNSHNDGESRKSKRSLLKKILTRGKVLYERNNDPLAWVEKAKEDFQLAQSALRRKRTLMAGECFHVQQCAEKHMKALLVRIIQAGIDHPC